MTTYKGKDLADFSEWELELAMKEFIDAEDKRAQASQHEKFGEGKMEFPPPNPEYLKLKSEIEKEIESRKSNA